MYVSERLRATNIAEYVLYLWQLEDLVRACEWKMERITTQIIDAYKPDEKQRTALARWYSDLIDMMRAEGVLQQGHLQMSKNVLIRLTDLHLELLHDPKRPDYAIAYHKTLPLIAELETRGGNNSSGNPIETCFNALYGMICLNMQGKEVSKSTVDAMRKLSKLIAMLAKYYHLAQEEELTDI